jgi:hypothetical protein
MYKKKNQSILISVIYCIILLNNYNEAFSQSDYRHGYIITNSHDTIEGLIDYGNINVSAYYCFFKKDSNSIAVKYTPDEILRVNIPDSRLLVSKEIQFEDKTERLFLEYLVNGVIDLYFLREKSGKDYYFVEKNDQIFELSNYTRIINMDGIKYEKESKQYIGALKYLAN